MTNTLIAPLLSTSYLNATGPIRYGMTNDCMFRTVLQRNNYVLKGLICSLLHLNPENIASVEITNPIELGETTDDKEFILDINVLMNNHTVINLEMQMAYQRDWQERSLSYLCRSFDQLYRGAAYGEIKPAIHIGFLNFTPCNTNTPEFYSSYQLVNTKTHDIYSDKFILRVVNLKQIELATEDDRANHIDYWARLFTATSWEDIKMIAQNDSFLSAASQSLYESNADEIIRQKCRAREEYYKREHAIKKLADEVASLQQQLAQAIAEKDSAIAEKDSAIAEKDSAIAEKDSIIQSLTAELTKEH